MDLFSSDFIAPRESVDLNDMRRRFAVLEKKVECGEFTPAEGHEFTVLKETLIHREAEEMAKWDRCFRK